MIITHFNKQHFKIQLGDLTLAINPVSKDSKEDVNKYGADIVLQSINHVDYNAGHEMSFGDKSPFIISSPGEYEIKDIFIKGFGTYIDLPIKNEKEKQKLLNTSFVFRIDNINICFLGAIKEELSAKQKEIINDVDILFIPLSKDEIMLNPYEASKIATKLEARVIIPMDYDKDSLNIFLKEFGKELKDIEKVDKLTIKRKDIENKQSEIILFNI